jgi:hypothetical protein
MNRYMYRALVELDPPACGGRSRQGTRAFMIQVRHIGQPSAQKSMHATISSEDQLPLRPGDRVVVTITVTDDDAPAYLCPGQSFTLSGRITGHGIVSRQVLTDPGPC